MMAITMVFLAPLAGLVLWFGNVDLVSNDPMFRGKPESRWIANLEYYDKDQKAKEWRTYGEEGIQVLIRGLENANPSGGRAYRNLNQRLPSFLSDRLPAPKPDSTLITRQCVVSLLARLGNDATSAVPIMIRTARSDEADSVRLGAIGFFITSNGDDCLGNRLPPDQKKALLPALMHAMQDVNNGSLRHNASILIKYFPENREELTPVLLSALQDSEPYVRLYAAEALNRVAPAVAKKARVTQMLVTIAKDPNNQRASKAVAALGHDGSEPDVAVPALIEFLQSTNRLIGCEAVWALEWAPQEFTPHFDAIIQALTIAGQRKDSVGGYARAALTKWRSRSEGGRGAK